MYNVFQCDFCIIITAYIYLLVLTLKTHQKIEKKKQQMVMQGETSPNSKQDSLTQALNNKKKVLSFLLFLLLLFFILLPLFSPLSGVDALKFGHMPSYHGCDMANHTPPLGECGFTPPTYGRVHGWKGHFYDRKHYD